MPNMKDNAKQGVIYEQANEKVYKAPDRAHGPKVDISAKQAIEQAQSAEELAKSALKKIENFEHNMNTGKLSEPVVNVTENESDEKHEDKSPSATNKTDPVSVLEDLASAQKEAIKVAEKVHHKAAKAEKIIADKKIESEEVEQALGKKLQANESPGLTIAGYKIGDLAQALIKPPEPSYEPQNISDPETRAEYRKAKKKLDSLKVAESEVQKVQKEAVKFKLDQENELTKLREAEARIPST